FGKNSMLIHQQKGSMFIIASLLLNQSFNFPKRVYATDHCGTCRACVEACPTHAIDEKTRTLKSQQCISTFTIELFKDAPAPSGYKNAGQWIFGCDICQQVCPWNRRETILNQTDLTSQQENLKHFFLDRSIEQIITEIEGMSNNAFERKFKQTSLARTGRLGVLKNIKAYL
ncbi:MAG: 4Fe-4S double cluster binding domain-containing protein, partial [Bdellovibrionota bacterium]